MGLEFSSDLGDPKFNPYPASCVFPSKARRGIKHRTGSFLLQKGCGYWRSPRLHHFQCCQVQKQQLYNSDDRSLLLVLDPKKSPQRRGESDYRLVSNEALRARGPSGHLVSCKEMAVWYPNILPAQRAVSVHPSPLFMQTQPEKPKVESLSFRKKICRQV